MNESVFIQYAPIIIVVFVFLVQQRLVVTPDQLEKKHREILDDVDKKYTTKEAHGLFQNQTEIDAYVNADGEKLQSVAKPGDVKFVDLNGDGIISDADKTKIGKGMPDWTYGVSLGADWKGVDV